MSADGGSDLVARARAFVLAHGDALQRARATALFDASARDTVCKLLGAIEDAASAATAIAVLDAIGVRRGAEVEQAVEILAATQRGDGSWSLGGEPDDGDGGDDGDDGARVVATAQIAGQLAKTPCARPKVLRAAGAFLAAHWSPDRVQGGDPQAIAGLAQWYANTNDELSDAALQWCGRELERGFRTGAIDALDTARVFALCDAQALPGARLAADEVVLSLAAAQSSDGSFGPAPAPAPVRVEATLDALAALQRLAPRKRA